jgi:hypothetical protein
LPAVLALLLAGATATAGPEDAVTDFRSQVHRAAVLEARFWKEFQNRYMDAMRALIAPTEKVKGDPKAPTDAVEDFTAFRALYAEFVKIASVPGEAARELAKSGHEKALPTVFAAVLATAAEVDGVEIELAGPPNPLPNGIFDLRPGVRRHGLAARETLLRAALAVCPGAREFLESDGWDKATKADGRASFERRVAVLDALRLAADPASRTFLEERIEERSSSLRIAALEALASLGRDATPAMLRLLDDPAPPVRFALLEIIPIRLREDARWVSPLHGLYEKSRGRQRADALAALEAVSRRSLGDDPTRWQAWLAEHKLVLEAGGPIPEPPADEGASRPKPADLVSFYGISAPTIGAVFVLDSSRALECPADVEFFRTRQEYGWWSSRPNTWQVDHPDLRTTLSQGIQRMLEAAPAELAFSLVAIPSGVGGLTGLGTYDATPLQRVTPATIKAAETFIAEMSGRGASEVWSGLLGAMEVAGLDPAPGAHDFPRAAADTAFLFHRGAPLYGRAITSEAVVGAFLRHNRFRRLRVHAIRIGDERDEAERTMRELAEGSGGTYLWARVAPPR